MSYPPPVYLDAEGAASAAFRPADTPPDLRIGVKSRIGYLATGESTQGRFGLQRWDLAPIPNTPGAHFHRTMAESFFVLEGSVALYDGTRWIDAVPGCDRVRLSPSDEDMEGSFDSDVLVGDGRANNMLGQPGEDRFYGGGGEDVIDARDGVRDLSIQCGRGRAPKSGRRIVGRATGRSLSDAFDPAPALCAVAKHGHPVDGLGNATRD